MIGKLDSLSYSMDGALIVSVSVPRAHADDLRKLVGQPVDAVIKKYRKKRSLNANALCWKICQLIADKINGERVSRVIDPNGRSKYELFEDRPYTKEDIYRKAIREVGSWDEVDVADYAVKSMQERWKRQGTGWVTEDMGPGSPGMRTVFLYYGSSTYNTQEMSRLLDYLVDDAKQLEIVMPATDAQVAEAKRRWNDA